MARRSLLGLATCAALACEQRPAPPPAASSVEPLPSAAHVADEERLAARAVDSALSGVRARLSVAAPRWELQPLAFGRKLLVRLTPDSVEALSTPELKLLFSAPLPGARAVARLPNGSVVALGEAGSLRIDPGSKRAVRLAPLVWMPGTVVLPERRDPALIWAAERVSRSLLRQRLAPPATIDVPATELDGLPLVAAPQATLPLDGYDGGAITVLRDGSLLYAASDGVRHTLPRGRPTAYPSGFVPWRLLPARRVDQAWAVAADGTVELWQLTGRLAVVQRLMLGAAPFDVAADERYLAAVVVDESPSAPRRFRLLVLAQEDGAKVLERALPEGPPPIGKDWAELAVRDRHVAVAEGEPFVAVGGRGALTVFRLPSGDIAFQR